MKEKYIGQKFNHLTVLEFLYKQKNGKKVFNCLCNCGEESKVRIDHLKSGDIKSCGCIRKKYKNTDIYELYRHMKSRCYNKKNKNYHNYGGRGIKVCDEWLNDYYLYRKWIIDQGYYKEHKHRITVDRINVNGNYSPKNCRLTTYKEQANNRRSNRVFYIKGERYTLMQICEKYNIKWSTMYNRLKKGWSIEKSINTPIDMRYSNRKHNRIHI